MQNKHSFEDFRKIMERLIAPPPEGCPWDSVQTHESLKRYLLEESYEVLEAIDNKDDDNLCEELGDVLLQVMFHSRLAEKEGRFSIDDVIDCVSRKMINRHRHIFGEDTAKDADEVLTKWEDIKNQEKGYKSGIESIRNIPKALPPLMRSEKVLSKAAKFNYINNDPKECLEQLKNKVSELEGKFENMCENHPDFDEIGEIFLILNNFSRIFQINSGFSLTNATEKFINKIEYIENAFSSNE